MSAKRKLILDPTGRFIAKAAPGAAVESPPGEFRQLLEPLKRICGN